MDQAIAQEKQVEISDENYPSIGFDVTGRVERTADGQYYWKVEVHVLGPDDVLTRSSKLFQSKRLATRDLIDQFAPTVVELGEQY